jgi:hypothetical protein
MYQSGKASTGIEGLDNIMSGGLTNGTLFLLEGNPGTGKTTLALQFLLQGLKNKQRVLYVTLSETKDELLQTAASHGWAIGDGLEIIELQPPESVLDPDQQQTILYSSDLELGETTKQILDAVESVKPKLMVLDSLSEIQRPVRRRAVHNSGSHYRRRQRRSCDPLRARWKGSTCLKTPKPRSILCTKQMRRASPCGSKEATARSRRFLRTAINSKSRGSSAPAKSTSVSMASWRPMCPRTDWLHHPS